MLICPHPAQLSSTSKPDSYSLAVHLVRCAVVAPVIWRNEFFFHLMCAYTPLNVLFHYVVSDTKSMTDHPYRDQIPVFTRPLIGNYYDPYDIAPVTRGLTRSTGRARVPPHLMLA